MLRAKKVCIYPTPKQANYLNGQFGSICFAYNKALLIKKQSYKCHDVCLSPHKDLKPLLTVKKKSCKYAWFKDYDSIAVQQGVINIGIAFFSFFNPKLKSGFPRFKGKNGKQFSYHSTSVNMLDGAIQMPKFLPVEARLHREINGEVRSITITRSATENTTPQHSVKTARQRQTNSS